MTDCLSILNIRLQHERHVVHARQRARDIAALLGFDRQEQVRLATATSELARNAFRYARNGTVEFVVLMPTPQVLRIEVRDGGPGIPHLQQVLNGQYQSKTGMGKGLIGTRRLMDRFEIKSAADGTSVCIGKLLPSPITEQQVRSLMAKLEKSDTDPFQEVERQNQELLRTLAELREKQELLAQVNSELEDTNRGVVALYAELEQNATDLRHVSEQKTRFISNLSHEFRTPLNAILALCGILKDRSDGELTEEQEKQVHYIRKSAADLSDMVNDLLDVAKVEAGKVDVKPTIFSVSDLFGALRGMLRTLLTSNAVDLVFENPGSFPLMFTDEPKLSQILRNLISNALKFTERGSVRVSAQIEGENAVFKVADTGIGIAQNDRERVFEEFVQISGTVQSRVRGTGLGLPLSRRLAELLGGTLTLESILGLGSTFTIVLPAQFEALRALPKVSSPLASNVPNVLIVEDNMETRFIHQAALKSSPYTLLFARSIAEARESLNIEDIAAVVLDRMLDGVDSMPFLEELRANGYRGKIIVVSVINDSRAPMNAGADAFLLKPVPGGKLAATLSHFMGGSQAKTLLLVDDDEINRYLLREALANHTADIVEARSGREAIQLALQQPIDAIFLDLNMPGLTGMETLRELKRMEQTAQIPVVIHTSKDLDEQELASIEKLGGSFFPKQLLTHTDADVLLRSMLQRINVI